MPTWCQPLRDSPHVIFGQTTFSKHARFGTLEQCQIADTHAERSRCIGGSLIFRVSAEASLLMGYIQGEGRTKEHCSLWYWTTLCQPIMCAAC